MDMLEFTKSVMNPPRPALTDKVGNCTRSIKDNLQILIWNAFADLTNNNSTELYSNQLDTTI
jgi:hypothetical protein